MHPRFTFLALSFLFWTVLASSQASFPPGNWLSGELSASLVPNPVNLSKSNTGGNIPECTLPDKVTIKRAAIDNLTVTWQGIPASDSKGGLRYEVRYKPEGKADPDFWKTVIVVEGLEATLVNLDHQKTYRIEVRKLCPAVENYPASESDWVPVKGGALPSPKSISLPPFTCGDPFSAPPCAGPYIRTGSFDTLYIGGFPIEVDSLWKVSDEEWNGNGFIPLPFNNSLVRVEWQQVKINAQGQICVGTVKGVSDDPMYYPDLDPGPIPFGGDICVPPPSTPGFDTNGIHSVTGLPWDENGFGPNGSYDQQPPYEGYEPGDPIDTSGNYDPWGFDANGIHFQTQTNQNPYGCSQEQLNSQPQAPPCDSLPPPYYWIDTTGTPPSLAGNALANQVEDSLLLWLEQILDEKASFFQDTIDETRDDCGGIRTIMNNQVDDTLHYERKYIFGPGDLYLLEGMSEHFTSTPQPLAQNLSDADRLPTQKRLEANHISLYHCDKKVQTFLHYLEIIETLRDNDLEEFADELLEKIRHFSDSDAEYYSDFDNFLQWLREQVDEKIIEEFQELYGASFSKEQHQYGNIAFVTGKQNAENRSHQSLNGSGGNFLADGSGEAFTQAFYESLEITPQDISFQFRQGWREINGIHRAYFLEEIANRRERAIFQAPPLLTAHDSTLMPIIVKNRASDGRLYKVYLDSLVFTQQTAIMSAYIVIELPHNGQKIVFEGHHINFGPTGFPTLPVKLQLGNDINVRLSNAARLVIKGTQNTYVSINCKGFAGIGVEADVELCRNIVKPIDSTGSVLPDPRRVRGHFQVFMPSWGEFYIELTMDPFVINSLEDVKWHIDTVALDFSETVSPSGTPPAGYACQFAGPGGFAPMWKGFYIKNLSATLPNQFSNNSQPITIGVEKVVIDDMGFSGTAYAAPLLSLNDGNAGGWAFSVDSFTVTVIANNLVKAGFNGLIHVPIISNAGSCNTGAPTANDCFAYDAFIEPGNIYHFDIHMQQGQNYCVDMWKAGEVILNANSSISMTLQNGNFAAVATLSGKVKINADFGNGISINIPQISFEGVEVSNQAPYFSPGNWQFPATIGTNFGGFGVTISKLNMIQTAGGDPALKFKAGIKITDDSIGLSATGGFQIVGELVTINGKQRWKFKEVGVDAISIDGHFAGVTSIKGSLEFYERDTVYGSGFRGGVSVQFEKLNNIGITAIAQFGRKNNYKYFFVDVLACGFSIPIVPTVLNLKGFGGGVYYHMYRDSQSLSLPACIGTPTLPTGLGESISGIDYFPDPTKGLGLKATVAVAAVKEQAFNGNVTFEILFNSGSGLSNIWLYGNARFMADLEMTASPVKGLPGQAPPNNNAYIKANLDVNLDFNAGIYHGQLEVFLNTPGNFLKGAGPGGRMGMAEAHFASNQWYIRVGRPTQRNGISMNIPVIGEIASVQTYLQIGKNGVDGIPDIPQDILDEVNGGQSFNPVNNRSALTENGTGFVFGAELNIGNKEFEFKPFYAGFHFKLGFDVSILDYGPNAICTESGEQVGINGWYATGQLYAGVWGKLGIKAKIFNKWKNFEILDIGAAAALQARLPNPFWAKGAVGGHFSIMNGLIKGNCNFKFELGEKCQIQGADNPAGELQIIQETLPVQGDSAVSPSINPLVTFNFPMEKTFTLPDINEDYVEYTPRLDYAKVMYKGYEISTSKKWDAEKYNLVLTPHYFLPENDSVTLKVKVHVDSSGQSIYEEERIVTFFTGDGLNNIPSANVAGSYPLHQQENFYKNEITNGKGYILLHKGQPDLFESDVNYYPPKIRFVKLSPGGQAQTLMVAATYNSSQNKIEFNIPASCLENEKKYKMQLVRIPKPSTSYGNGSGGPAAMQQAAMAANTGDDGPPAIDCGYSSGSSSNNNSNNNANNSNNVPYQSQTQTSSTNDDTPPPPQEQVLYWATFRVSQYNTFLAKAEAIAAARTCSYSNGTINCNINIPEDFDKFERGQVPAIGALVSMTPNFSSDFNINKWYQDSIKTLIYDGFPDPTYNVKLFDSRMAEPWGLPAVNKISLGVNNISCGIFHQFSEDLKEFKYDINMYLYSGGYYGSVIMPNCTINNVVDVCHCNSSEVDLVFPAKLKRLHCRTGLPTVPNGNYNYIFSYRLPGTTDVTSIKSINLVKN